MSPQKSGAGGRSCPGSSTRVPATPDIILVTSLRGQGTRFQARRRVAPLVPVYVTNFEAETHPETEWRAANDE